MPDTYNYPAEIERDEDGRFVITFPDFGWGTTGRRGRAMRLWPRPTTSCANSSWPRFGKAQCSRNRQVPADRRSLVVPPVQIALKAALYEAWREAGISQRHLARDLGVAESEVRRMLNPEHSTKAAKMDSALQRLGKRVTLTVASAA